ncbi:MAG: glycosyltransferase [Fervidobacterium sp.]
MKILQINSVCGRGSTGRIVLEIHEQLTKQGHESYIAYGRTPSSCQEAIRIGNNIDIYTHVLKTRLFDLHGFGSKNATKQFLKKIDKINPDIIHLHNIHGYYINIQLLFEYIKEKEKPVVWTLHDCWAFTGHCSHFEFVGCYKWKTTCNNCPQKDRYPRSWLLDNSKRNWERKKELFTNVKKMILITPSKWLAELVKESFLKEYQVEVIPNTIDTNIFKPMHSDFRKRYKLEEKFIILGVANVWEERKGLKHFIELSKMIKPDEVIVLVGLNKKQVKELKKYGIIGIERTNSAEELAQIYTAADVFVNPTLEENYPTVNLEAQACGTFVITFNSGGAKETIQNKSSGIVINEKSTEAILLSIQKLRSEKSTIKQHINKNNFQSKKSIEKIINIYLSILNDTNN